MSSLVYFKFKANVKTDSIPFDGSSISVKDLKAGIRAKCRLHSTDFDLKLEDTTGKTYTKDDELIPKYTSIIVCRVPRITGEVHKRKINAPEEVPWRELQRNVIANIDAPHANKHVNLAESDLPEEEKIKIMMERSAEAYSEKNFTVKAKPYGIPPAAYICHKCNLPGHWIHNCPGVRDKSGKMMDVKTVKRPTGIPQDFLLEVDAGTPGAYLGKSGKYMVPIKDAEAYAQGKKDKRPFSVEENPPYVIQERIPPKQFICPLCDHMFREAVLVSCCGTTYCNECIMGHVFDAQVLGSHRCPTCDAVLTDHESSVFENALVRSMIRDWLANETVIPDAETVPMRSDVFKIDDSEKVICTWYHVCSLQNFVNNRRVLKPKQASSVVAPQVKVELPQDAPVTKEEEVVDDIKTDARDISPIPSKLPTPKDSSPSPPTSVDSKLDAKVTVVTTKPTIVSPNTCATVVASAPCATLVTSIRQPMLAAAATNSLASTQLSCHSYTSTAAVMPNMIPGITAGNNPLLNAICGMQLDNLRPHVVAPQSILSAQFQGSMVGGSDWSVGSALATSVAHGATLVDPVLQASNNQAAFSLVPAQGIPGVLPMAVPAPIQTIDGHKVLSKEEFYRLKMEMLHSSRRRHRRRHSRSRSPAQSYHRSSRHSDHRYSRHERSSRERHRERRPSAGYEYGRRTESDHNFEPRREYNRISRRPGLSSHTDLGSPYDQQYYRDDRRYVREPHGKPRSDPRYMGPRKEAWGIEPRTTSISPPQRDLRERLRRVREPHALEQYTISDNSLTESCSPLVNSVVPQYGLSETESTSLGDYTTDKDFVVKRRAQLSRENSESLYPEVNVNEANTVDNNADVITQENTHRLEVSDVLSKKRKKEKKKKHKHKHSENRNEDVSAHMPMVLDEFEQPVFIGDRTQVDQTAADFDEVGKKKHKKHKKHKDKRKKHTRDLEMEQQC